MTVSVLSCGERVAMCGKEFAGGYEMNMYLSLGLWCVHVCLWRWFRL